MFYSNNQNLFNEVYSNTMDYYVKSQKDTITYTENEKPFLFNHIIKSKNKNKDGYFILTINKVKKNKSH